MATWGNDGSGDGSIGDPFATIGRAVQDATPGTAVRVHAGTYSGGTYLADVAGTPSAPIWIGGAPGEPRPLISGSSQAIHLVRAKYVVVHDLEVASASANGINADDGGDYNDPLAAHHVVFRWLDIHDIGSGGNQDCLNFLGLNDYWVMDSKSRTAVVVSRERYRPCGMPPRPTARNEFRNLSGNAVQSKGGSEDIEIRWNRVRNRAHEALRAAAPDSSTFGLPSR